MALNIPMPDLPGNALMKGLDTGSTLFSRYMQPIIQREQLAEQGKYHAGTLAQQQREMEQRQQQFLQELALRKQQERRLAQSAALQQQMAQLQMQNLRNKLNPNYEIEQLKRLNEAFGENNKSNQKQLESFIPSITGQQQNQIPESAPLDEPKKNELDLESIKRNPILRGWFKKHFGIDPAEKESLAYQGAAREAYDLERLKKEAGENSAVYQNALSDYKSKQQARNDLSTLRDRTIEGLKPGEKWIKDPNTGQNIGIEKAMSDKERHQEEGRIFFNKMYPIVYEGFAPYSGENSITKLEQDISRYKSDPAARQRIDKFLDAEKALTTTTINEVATLGAANTNRTYQQFRDQLEIHDIPSKLKSLFKQYQLPASAQLNSAKRFQKYLNEGQEYAKKRVPARRKLYFNPEQQFADDQSKVIEDQKPLYKPTDKVKVQLTDGSIKTMTYEEALKIGAQ